MSSSAWSRRMGAKRPTLCSMDLRSYSAAPFEYKDHDLLEMDLDALIERNPGLALVDELAHTNASGSRHPKRYLDVEELLSRGIDVYTTLNIQHIESLNDVVAQITGVHVRETVPDSILDRADAIELVDLTPDDLIQRLKEGKVYVPKQAERALEHFFSPANLTALRELALRRTAERVDEQLLDEMQARAISGPWPAGERLLICVSEDPRAAGLVRYTKRLADRLHGPWTALYIETKRSLQLTEEERDRIADTLRLAQALGGEPVTIPGGDRRIADDVVGFAQANNVTQIVIGKSMRSSWFELLHGSVVRDLLRCCGNISVHVIAGENLDKETIPRKTVRTAEKTAPFDPRPYLFALLAVAVATGISSVLWPWIGTENTDLVYLTAVVGTAVRFGLWPSLLAGAVSALCYNFFFTSPYYTFAIADPRNVIAVVFFAIVAVVVSNVAARARTLAVTAMARARTTESLYAFSRKLSGAGTLDDVLWASAYQAALMLKVRVVLLLPENGSLAVRTGYPPEDNLDEADLAAAKWAWDHDRAAGRGSDTLPGAKRLFLPMRTGRGLVGVVGIDSDKPGPLLTPDQRRLLDALIDQAALAIERVHLVDDLDQAKRRVEADRLRAALLTSISHDLKTPLASIVGAAGALKDLSGALDEAAKADLVATILEEFRAAQPLHRQSARHDEARVRARSSPTQGGTTSVRSSARCWNVLEKSWYTTAWRSTSPKTCQCSSSIRRCLSKCCSICSTMPPKYASPQTTVLIQSWQEAETVKLQIVDEGSGIPTEEIDRIFDKFHRADKQDQVRAGTGLGLAILAASSKPWAARSLRRTGPTGLAPRSPSPYQSPSPPRGWTPPHECSSSEGPGGRRRAADPQIAAHGARDPRLSDHGCFERQDRSRAHVG